MSHTQVPDLDGLGATSHPHLPQQARLAAKPGLSAGLDAAAVPLSLSDIDKYDSNQVSLVPQLLGDSEVLYGWGTAYSIVAYGTKYVAKINAYVASTPSGAKVLAQDIETHTFFRRQYQALLKKIYDEGLGNFRQEGEAPGITLEALLGEAGMALCLLAIEEETYSLKYREAVFNQAVKGYDGDKWEEQPGIFLTGPSGTGKSHAVENIAEVIGSKHVSKEHANNFLINVDGEPGRFDSHVYQETVNLAQTFNFVNVPDLHDQTKKYTESAKRVLRAAAFEAAEKGTAGFIKPETLTDYFVSFNIRNAVKRFIDLAQASKITPIFVEIKANADAVRHDAEAREKIQSKKYNPNGFRLSEFCSTYVKRLVRAAIGGLTTFVTYTNDRILVKPVGDTWVKAQYGDKGAMAVSQRVFADWWNLAQHERPDFEAYVSEQNPPALLSYDNALTRARKQLNHCVDVIKTQPGTTEQKAKIAYLKTILESTEQRKSKSENVTLAEELTQQGKIIVVKGKTMHPQFLFSAREREAISAVLDALTLGATQTKTPSLSGQRWHLFAGKREEATQGKNRLNIITQLQAYIDGREQQIKSQPIREALNVFGHSGDEKLAVARNVLQQLSNGKAAIMLNKKHAEIAKDGRLGDIIRHLVNTGVTTDNLQALPAKPLLRDRSLSVDSLKPMSFVR